MQATSPATISVAQIARHIVALHTQTMAPHFDAIPGTIPPTDARELDNLLDQIEVAQSIAFTMPVHDIADAAAVLALAANEVAFLTGYDLDADDRARRQRRVAAALAGALPIVASAAETDLADLIGDRDVGEVVPHPPQPPPPWPPIATA